MATAITDTCNVILASVLEFPLRSWLAKKSTLKKDEPEMHDAVERKVEERREELKHEWQDKFKHLQR
eukprot:4027858-Pyramimonas_sp.AAC.1